MIQVTYGKPGEGMTHKPIQPVSEFRQMAGINGRTAEKVLCDFVLCGLISYQAGEKGVFYRLSNEFVTGG